MEAAVIPLAVPERHLYRITEAMRLLSMSRSVIYEQLRAGRLRSV
jgi:predicted DNA-binding transcriptional regulator AlpA